MSLTWNFIYIFIYIFSILEDFFIIMVDLFFTGKNY